MSFGGFGKESGPAMPPRAATPFGHFPHPPSPSPPPPAPAPAPSFSSSSDSPLSGSPRSFIAYERAISPLPFDNAQLSTGPRTSSAPNRNFGAHENTRSPLPFDNAQQPSGSHMPSTSSRAASLRWSKNQSLPIGGFGGPMQKRSPAYGQHDTTISISSKFPRSQDTVRTRSPVQYTDDFLANPIDVGMEVPTSFPSKSRSGTNVSRMPDYKNSPRLSPAVDGPNDDISVKQIAGQSVPKRNRSPPATCAGHVSQISFSNEDDAERELQAKARRLARFKTELNEGEPGNTLPYGLDVAAKKGISSMKADQSLNEKRKFPRDVSGTTEEVSQENDNEDLQTCSVIVGLCPDMCPESERAERERKGDLDRYERVDGDRNQTNKALAVKKYNRTAEREAELIRPMSILRKTMDYLLGLLDQPYDDRFLGLYNFLWDRMRAIRMDLRMQHIFDHEAITMLEQMIRLHIIAMHELCEFSKGEGFSEGFDAHLNIEQMNKTSVELFQLYDDHRKRGIYIPTEKEFRGYYALLKLDKHPGYKVEPAELSLDLAKMTTEIRQTHEVLFARDVARSCRTSNFIAFFRHGRRASYLQACLIHAHFSKLRTQALVSLHTGLLYNQGLPVSHVSNWLGMEGEDIESLLEYHGFSMKEFEEPYMVKEGPFLNADKDYPTRCSMLVHGKKSNKIVEDMLSSRQPPVVPSESKKELHLDKSNKHKHVTVQPTQTKSSIVSGVMEKYMVSSPRNIRQVKVPLDTSKIDAAYMEINHSAPLSSPKSNTGIPWTFSSFQEYRKQGQPSPATPKASSVIINDGELSGRNPSWSLSTPQLVPDKQPVYIEQPRATFYAGLASFPENSSGVVAQSEVTVMNSDMRSADVNKSVSPACEADPGYVSLLDEEFLMEEETRNGLVDAQQNVENDVVNYYDQEVAEAKLKLFIRRWRRRSARKKELREQNRLAANAAFSSLSLGPPVHHNKDKPTSIGKLNIDQAVSKRYEKCQQSWARCNISELVAAKLGEKNAYLSCICWKVVVFSWLHWEHVGNEVKTPITHMSLDQWLHYKLIPSQKDDTACDLVTSAPGMAIWRKWVSDGGGCSACCLSVIKDAKSGNVEKNLLGTSGLLFAVSEIVPWELQRVQLHNLVMSLPAGASVPLLIVSGSIEDNVSELSSTIVDKLGLKDIDNSRVGSFLVKCVNERDDTGQLDGYFSDQNLKEGFTWLASETRTQLVLYRVTLRDLVSSHLNMCLDTFDSMDINKLDPNSYISVFNDALDRSVNDILVAANMNRTNWPCPELYLLDNSISEFKAVRQFLPSLGWSSSEEVEPLVSVLKKLKLPCFSDDLGWLSRTCNTAKDIEDKRYLLQDCLIRYLTQSRNIMNSMMAAKEASVMLQQCVRLELLNAAAAYKVVPNWSLIFRRVFSWQLNTLVNINRKAYVLEQSHSNSRSEFLEKLEFEASRPHYISHPSLDEMVEVSCSPVVSRIGRSVRKSIDVCRVTSTSDTSMCTMFNNSSSEKGNQFPIGQVQTVNLDVNRERTDLQLTPNNTEKDADRLTNLLDRCNILQDEIENKLSIFF